MRDARGRGVADAVDDAARRRGDDVDDDGARAGRGRWGGDDVDRDGSKRDEGVLRESERTRRAVGRDGGWEGGDDDAEDEGVVAAQDVAGVGHVRGRHGDAVVHGERRSNGASVGHRTGVLHARVSREARRGGDGDGVSSER